MFDFSGRKFSLFSFILVSRELPLTWLLFVMILSSLPTTQGTTTSLSTTLMFPDSLSLPTRPTAPSVPTSVRLVLVLTSDRRTLVTTSSVVEFLTALKVCFIHSEQFLLYSILTSLQFRTLSTHRTQPAPTVVLHSLPTNRAFRTVSTLCNKLGLTTPTSSSASLLREFTVANIVRIVLIPC